MSDNLLGLLGAVASLGVCVVLIALSAAVNMPLFLVGPFIGVAIIAGLDAAGTALDRRKTQLARQTRA